MNAIAVSTVIMELRHIKEPVDLKFHYIVYKNDDNVNGLKYSGVCLELGTEAFESSFEMVCDKVKLAMVSDVLGLYGSSKTFDDFTTLLKNTKQSIASEYTRDYKKYIAGMHFQKIN